MDDADLLNSDVQLEGLAGVDRVAASSSILISLPLLAMSKLLLDPLSGYADVLHGRRHHLLALAEQPARIHLRRLRLLVSLLGRGGGHINHEELVLAGVCEDAVGLLQERGGQVRDQRDHLQVARLDQRFVLEASLRQQVHHFQVLTRIRVFLVVFVSQLLRDNSLVELLRPFKAVDV